MHAPACRLRETRRALRCRVPHFFGDACTEYRPSECSQPGRDFTRLLEGPVDAFDKGCVRSGIREFSQFTIEKRFTSAVCLAADDRNSTRERFQEDDAESLAPARKRKDVGQAKVIGLAFLRDETGEDHMPFDAERSRLLCETLA